MVLHNKIVFALAVLVLMIACEKDPEEVRVESVSLSQPTAEMLVGESVQLSATVLPSNATDKTVIWASSKQSVATVTESGRVTAIAEGVSTITASASGKSATCMVTVSKGYVAVSSVTLNKSELILEEGGSETLVATVSPDNASDKTVTWESSNTSIAMVDENGKVSAIKEGSVIIKAKVKSLDASCSVVVRNPYISFADNLVKFVLVSLYDTNQDGEISYKEASSVSVLPSKLFGSYSKGIKSFQELQFFTGLTEIPHEAFKNCESMESVIIPEGVTCIGSYAFGWCYSLRNVKLPSTLKTISEYGLFATNIEELILPENLETLGRSALSSTQLRTIRIPDSVTSIGKGVLRNCCNLQSIYGRFSSADNRCIVKDGTLIAFAPYGLVEYSTPEDVRVVSGSAFSFEKSTTLVKIILNEGVLEIQRAVFEYNKTIETIILPSTILTIGSLGYAKDIYIKSINPPINNLFPYSYDPTELKWRKFYVPSQSVELYESSEWKSATIIGIDYE